MKKSIVFKFGMVLGTALLSLGCAARPQEWVWATRSPSALQSVSAAPAAAEAAPPQWRKRNEAELAPGFEVDIVSPADSSVSGTYRIEPDGALRLPYKVRVDAAGQTAGGLREALVRAYRPFIKNPAFTVTPRTKAYWVDVQGLVSKPGPVLVKSDSSLDEIIAGAGGLQQTNEHEPQAQYVRVVQGGANGIFKLRDHFAGTLIGLPAWQGGEKIVFQSEGGGSGAGKVSRSYINLLGQVARPGEYPYEHGDFVRYLIAAGGPTDRADLDNISLVRASGDAVGTMSFTFHEPRELPELQPGDTVIVQADNPSPIEKRSRVIGGYMSILTSIATVVLLFVVV